MQEITNVLLQTGLTYYAAFSDASGSALPATQGLPTQRRLANVYNGGGRLTETEISPDIDLKFSVAARQHPADYARWALTIPAGLPKGFGEAISPGGMLNGWKYFFGLEPLENEPSRWPRITAGHYGFVLNPLATDVFWRIHHTPTLQAPFATWSTADASDPNVLFNPIAGEVQFSLPNADAGFFRLEIGLDE